MTATENDLVFSNPKSQVEFDDWPCGGERVKCKFWVEKHATRGFRVCRQTTDRRGQWCKPKATTYGGFAAIVEGNDGRTYVLQVSDKYASHICVYRHDFMQAAQPVFPDHADFQKLMSLILEVGYQA